MKRSYLYRATLLVSLPLVMASCGGKKPNPETAASDTTSKDTAAVVADAGVDANQLAANKQADFAQKLPSPVHIARIFKKSGLKYVSGIANPVENTSKYATNGSLSLNLGVYSTDLAYAALNKQTDVAGKYFKAVNKLAEGLNLSTIFQKNGFAKRFESNMTNQDSLLHLMSELQAESDELLKETNRYDVVNLGFAGAWTESMYLASVIYSKQGTIELGNRVAQQGPVLSALLKLLKLHENDATTKEVITALTEMKTIIDAMSATKGSTSPEWKEKFTKELQPKIEALRKSIIEKA